MAVAVLINPSALPSTASVPAVANTTFATQVDQLTPLSASELLVSRISSALYDLGYNDDSVTTVAARVNANIVNGRVDLETISIEEIGQLLDTDILNRERLRSRNLYLNSNEPVLLLEIPDQSEKSVVELARIKAEFIKLLRARSITPVRVYVRKVDDLKPCQFGFSLLNVVNTDVGGPGMVQLLDAAFHNEDWKKDLIVKEAFNGEDLIWRDEIVVGSLTQQHEQPAPTFEPEMTEIADEEAELVPESTELYHEDGLPRSSSLAYRDINEVPEEHEEDQDVPIEHPAMVEYRQWEASRQHVEHPSWVREHDGDLLDIITTQSASIQDEDTALTTKPASDDFELVDKA